MSETIQANDNTEEKRELATQKYIDELWKDHHYSVEQFDKQLLFISSGALALSLTFFANVVPLEKATYIWLYTTALTFFSICIALCLISHLVSAKLIKKRIIDVENKRYGIEEDKVIPCLNTSMVITLLLAIFTLVLFTILNINNMGKNDNEKPTFDNGGTKERIGTGKEIKPMPPVLKPANPNQSSSK